ncbi:MAG: helix-turn-helix domain-containing protein [Thermotogaceae bacterium]|nr:helix-turn-helix domain-containing protein [Thermotogaceae bacterium]
MLKVGNKHYYTTLETADLLGVGDATVRRKIARGELKAKRINNRFFVDADSISAESVKPADAKATIGLFKRLLENSTNIREKENGEHVFYSNDGIPLMVARFTTASDAVESLGEYADVEDE